MSIITKTDNAQKVLVLMGSYDDGQERYLEFVLKVAKEAGITREQLEKELDPFI